MMDNDDDQIDLLGNMNEIDMLKQAFSKRKYTPLNLKFDFIADLPASSQGNGDPMH